MYVMDMDGQFIMSFIIQAINVVLWVFIVIFAIRVYKLVKLMLKKFKDR